MFWLIVLIMGSIFQGFYAMDNFTYSAVASVPEPATYAMLVVGLLAVGGIAIRRRT